MNKAEATLIARELADAADAVYAKHGLKRSKVSSTFDDGMHRITLTATSTDPALDPKVTDWNRYAETYGLPVDALGKEIVYAGKSYRIDGLIPSRRKFPVAAFSLGSGKEMLLTVRGVKGALGIKVEAWD